MKEPILCSLCTDDEPDDGAQHYVVIYGFHNPHLIAYLSELGITVESIVKISSQDYSRFQKQEVPDVEKDEKTLGKELQLLEAYKKYLSSRYVLLKIWRKGDVTNEIYFFCYNNTYVCIKNVFKKMHLKSFNNK